MSAACCQPVDPAEARASATTAPTIKREDVAALAHLATSLDYPKNRFPDPMWRAALKRAVCAMHGVAAEIDGEHGFGIYAREDGQ